MKDEIFVNQIQCLTCGQVLRSLHRHDYRACGCGPAVDGGHDYLRRGFSTDRHYIECSIVKRDGRLVQLWTLVDLHEDVELLPPISLQDAILRKGGLLLP